MVPTRTLQSMLSKSSLASSSSASKKNSSLSSRSSKPSSSNQPSKKRKLSIYEQDGHDTSIAVKSSSGKASHSPSKKKKQKAEPSEKRLKMFRKQPPQSYLQKLDRARNQRMIVIGRTRIVNADELREDIDIVGTTGNIYTVSIGRLPSCTCPDSKKGHECKHKVYALHTVLKAPEHLQYQQAFLTDELEQIFMNGPSIPNNSVDSEEQDGKRKPIEGECPICYMDLDPEQNQISWCKGGCGNNIHKDCFDQWAASQRGNEVRCVYCRALWEMEMGDIKTIKKAGEMTGEGYLNVAEQFGLSRVRDTSSYYQPWAIRNSAGGY